MELHWGAFRVHVIHTVGPSLLRVEIEFPATVLVFSPSPVWHSESLVDSPWSPMEGYVTNSLQEGVWMEVLSIHVPHDVGLLVEFDRVHIFDPVPYMYNNKLNHIHIGAN